jgi:hypothetical protein
VSTSLTRRVFDEYRRVITPLAAALVLNIAAYAFFVYPLSQRVANVAQRNQDAEQALTGRPRRLRTGHRHGDREERARPRSSTRSTAKSCRRTFRRRGD